MELEYKGYKVDDASQRIIKALGEEERAIASDLARLADLSDAQSVRYRIDEYLGPDAAKLVDEVGTRTVAGGEAQIYSLSDAGEAALEVAPDHFAAPHDPKEYRQQIESLRETVETLRDRLERESNRIDNRPTHKTVERTQDQFETMLDEANTHAERSWNAADNAHDALQEIRERDDDLADQLADLHDQLDQCPEQGDLDDLRHRVDALESRIEDIEATQRDWQARVRRIEDRQSRRLLPRLLRWWRGH